MASTVPACDRVLLHESAPCCKGWGREGAAIGRSCGRCLSGRARREIDQLDRVEYQVARHVRHDVTVPSCEDAQSNGQEGRVCRSCPGVAEVQDVDAVHVQPELLLQDDLNHPWHCGKSGHGIYTSTVVYGCQQGIPTKPVGIGLSLTHPDRVGSASKVGNTPDVKGLTPGRIGAKLLPSSPGGSSRVGQSMYRRSAVVRWT